jgi:ankyrin repeat protein
VLLFGLWIAWQTCTPIQWLCGAVQRGDVVAVEGILDAWWGPNVDDSCKHGMSVLHHAAEAGDIEMVQTLVRYGADIENEVCTDLSSSERPPLHDAIWSGNTELVRWFLMRGARVNHRDEFDQSALAIAVRQRVEIARELLDHGADARELGLLHRAATEGEPEIVALLIDRGADVNQTHGGITPLHAVLMSDDPRSDVVNVLLGRGADRYAVCRSWDGRFPGYEPLQIAAAQGYSLFVRLLVNAGCDPGRIFETRDGQRLGLIEIARLHERPSMEKWLAGKLGVQPLYQAEPALRK